MRISYESFTGPFRGTEDINLADKCADDKVTDGWLTDVYRYESSEHQARRSFQRLAYRIKRRNTFKAQ